ncbi:hypothetical protein GOBAR_AA32167 [Gossypium barbadense]|uniref:PHD-type domain-containing protein n=1 Tax=Gossypium barbadense TaxID=3634 RepID=A0A2P5WBQ6_GOSBA|nr:hypothetical protein GOBAR_AA32167 [Gossypium barbadense]
MKRELDYGLDGSLGQTREAVTQSQTQASSSSSYKRVNNTQVNGYIVYTRVKKSRINCRVSENSDSEKLEVFNKPIKGVKVSLIDEDQENKTLADTSGVNNNLNEGRSRNGNVAGDKVVVENVIDESLVVRDIVKGGPLIEALVEESHTIGENAIVGNLVVEAIGIDGRHVVQSSQSMDELETYLVEKRGFDSSDGDDDDLLLKTLRRPKKSFLRPKVETEESLVCEEQNVENVLVSTFGGEEAAEESGLTTPRKNLELKMSKKISLNKCPMTVKELFDTGLLDGVPVVYMGTISSKTAGLRGIITDGGILCSCSLCKGRRVVPPSQFEIHACKQYKRAAQYICFENGKSLLEVNKARVIHKVPEEAVKPVLMSKTFKGASSPIFSPYGSQWKKTTKDQQLHKLVFEEDGLPDGTEVAYYARGQRLLEGYKKGFGIICRCCNCEVSPSQFEAHAGWASRRKPYAHIYTSNGVSLHELAISLSKGRLYSAKDNDVACIICADGGNLLLCDGCPRAFHKECASLPTIPHGRWYCKYCQNMFMREKCSEHNANAAAAGRILGVDAIEQITSRCIRIVKNIEAELSGCALCRACDFSKSGFGPRTVILCDQCEKEYHIGCLRTHKMADLREIPKGKWFCCSGCGRIHSTLQKLLIHGAERLPDSLLDVLKKKYVEKGLDADINIDVRWRLLSGKFASPETRLLLSQAVGIFHECFNPIVDAATGRDLIPCMVYGRNLKGQEYGGMYCAVLTINSFVVSAGIIRVFGQEIAEIPLVATSIANHGKGYFQLLFSCIEKLLAFLNVKNIVLPAAEEAESIWTDKFGFKKLRPDQLSEYRKSCCQMVIFQGTSMLQKEVPTDQLVSSIERTELYKHMNQGRSYFLE